MAGKAACTYSRQHVRVPQTLIVALWPGWTQRESSKRHSVVELRSGARKSSTASFLNLWVCFFLVVVMIVSAPQNLSHKTIRPQYDRMRSNSISVENWCDQTIFSSLSGHSGVWHTGNGNACHNRTRNCCLNHRDRD